MFSDTGDISMIIFVACLILRSRRRVIDVGGDCVICIVGHMFSSALQVGAWSLSGGRCKPPGDVTVAARGMTSSC